MKTFLEVYFEMPNGMLISFNTPDFTPQQSALSMVAKGANPCNWHFETYFLTAFAVFVLVSMRTLRMNITS